MDVQFKESYLIVPQTRDDYGSPVYQVVGGVLIPHPDQDASVVEDIERQINAVLDES